jgi:Protein of unknown function (DUF1778)
MQNTTTSTRKTEVFQLRLSPEDKAVMEKAAEARGVSLAGFLRSNGLAAASTKLEQAAARYAIACDLGDREDGDDVARKNANARHLRQEGNGR